MSTEGCSLSHKVYNAYLLSLVPFVYWYVYLLIWFYSVSPYFPYMFLFWFSCKYCSIIKERKIGNFVLGFRKFSNFQLPCWRFRNYYMCWKLHITYLYWLNSTAPLNCTLNTLSHLQGVWLDLYVKSALHA